VIAVDTNLLVYTHQSGSEHHNQAKKVIESIRGEAAPWAIPWPCVHEFIYVTTNPKVYKRPATAKEALAVIDVLVDGSDLHFLSESSGYLEKLKFIATSSGVKGDRP